MCDLKKGFKLCSCSAEKLKDEDVDWILRRVNHELPLVHRRGKAAIRRYTAKEEILKTDILVKLNEENCFDFEYQPKEDDFLMLKIPLNDRKKRFAYRYSKGQWKEDKSTSLAAWKTQLSLFKNGKVDF